MIQRAASASRGPRRAALTLLELLVVLVLIVAIAAITFPLARTMLSDSRLSAAGDQVRARLADTRALAMEQGRPFRFGYLANTGRYQVAPEDDPSWDTVEAGDADYEDLLRGELPLEIVFDPSGNSGDGWEEGAVYLPDGSARDDVLLTFGKAGLPPLQVRLRGLTGAVSLVDPATEELP